MHYLTNILLKFASSKNGNREPERFEDIILTENKLQLNNRYTWILN